MDGECMQVGQQEVQVTVGIEEGPPSCAEDCTSVGSAPMIHHMGDKAQDHG